MNLLQPASVQIVFRDSLWILILRKVKVILKIASFACIINNFACNECQHQLQNLNRTNKIEAEAVS